MLRRRLSAGALRATAQLQQAQQAQLHTAAVVAAPKRNQKSVTPAAAAARANIQPAAHSKSLASAVLLNTQRSWKNEKVVTLKAELKRRNLSQQGNKATLIARLISADTTGQLPPVPPVKAPGKQARRSVSTSRVAQKAKDEEPKPGDVTHTAGDAPIHAPTSGKSPEPVAEEIAASHPGLPIKEKTTSAPIDIKIPKHRDPKEDPQVIPYTPDNFQQPQRKEEPKIEKPLHQQVYTPASTATHPGGGPLHSAKQASDTQLEPEMVWDESGKPVSKADRESLLTAAEVTELGGIPVQLPVWNAEDHKYEPINRPLSEGEKQGLWVLGLGFAGIVGLGYLDNKWTQAKAAKKHEQHSDKDEKKN